MKRPSSALGFSSAAEDDASLALAASLAGEEAAGKRVRRSRPLDLDKPIPVLFAGRRDETLVHELVALPGAAVIENQEDIFTTEQLIQALNECPETSFAPGPGLYIQDLTVAEGPKKSEVAVPDVAMITWKDAPLAPYRRPKDLIRREPGPATECKQYDATPEDAEYLEGLRGRVGGIVELDDLERIFVELEREAFCAKERAAVQQTEARVLEAQEDLTAQARELLLSVRGLLDRAASEGEESEEEEEDRPRAKKKKGKPPPARKRAASEDESHVGGGASVVSAMGNAADAEWAEERYAGVLRLLLQPLMHRAKPGKRRVELEDLVEELLGYWRGRRAEAKGALVRAYQSFPLLPNWGTQTDADVPAEMPDADAMEENRQAYEKLLAIRYELDRARTLADVTRRREKLKRECLRIAVDLGLPLSYTPDPVEAPTEGKAAGNPRLIPFAFEPLYASLDEFGLEAMLAAAEGVRVPKEPAPQPESEGEEEKSPRSKEGDWGKAPARRRQRAEEGDRGAKGAKGKGAAKAATGGSSRHAKMEVVEEEESGGEGSEEEEEEEVVEAPPTRGSRQRKLPAPPPLPVEPEPQPHKGQQRGREAAVTAAGNAKGSEEDDKDKPKGRGGRGGLGKCPVPGCNGGGHVNPKFLTHESKSGCPTFNKKEQVASVSASKKRPEGGSKGKGGARAGERDRPPSPATSVESSESAEGGRGRKALLSHQKERGKRRLGRG